MESSTESVKRLIENCRAEITERKYVQTPKQMLLRKSHLKEINRLMRVLLDGIERSFS